MEPVLVRNYPSGVKPRETGNCENRYYTVADICAMLGITRKTLFFYDREDLLKPHRRQGPQRAKLYLFEDVERLRTILEYKKAGLLLKEIRCILEEDNAVKQEIFVQALVRAEQEKAQKEEEIRRLKYWIASTEP
ncbi:MAG: MerR family transcriptional regulator [Solobacterium sp.]|nr:MerR family transcriptional regulator [Solobacterium sp.]MBR2794690.1 MerR family transcriptional regulator [Solobacterium sp.]